MKLGAAAAAAVTGALEKRRRRSQLKTLVGACKVFVSGRRQPVGGATKWIGSVCGRRTRRAGSATTRTTKNVGVCLCPPPPPSSCCWKTNLQTKDSRERMGAAGLVRVHFFAGS